MGWSTCACPPNPLGRTKSADSEDSTLADLNVDRLVRSSQMFGEMSGCTRLTVDIICYGFAFDSCVLFEQQVLGCYYYFAFALQLYYFFDYGDVFCGVNIFVMETLWTCGDP